MSENFKGAFPACLFWSFIIIKAVAIGCLNFPTSTSLETVLSKMFHQKIKCNTIPGRNGFASFSKNKIILSPAVNSFFFFFFFLPLITCEFLLVGSPYCPPFFSSAWRTSQDGGGKPVPFCLLEGYGGQLLWGRISALSRVLAPPCS